LTSAGLAASYHATAAEVRQETATSAATTTTTTTITTTPTPITITILTILSHQNQNSLLNSMRPWEHIFVLAHNQTGAPTLDI
jgi:hypothetical protein